jgi:hypothetical protein
MFIFNKAATLNDKLEKYKLKLHLVQTLIYFKFQTSIFKIFKLLKFNDYINK